MSQVFRTQVYKNVKWSGWDLWKYFLPERAQAMAAARKILPHVDLSCTKLVIQMKGGSYRVLDRSGNVEPCAHVATPGGPQ